MHMQFVAPSSHGWIWGVWPPNKDPYPHTIDIEEDGKVYMGRFSNWESNLAWQEMSGWVKQISAEQDYTKIAKRESSVKI